MLVNYRCQWTRPFCTTGADVASDSTDLYAHYCAVLVLVRLGVFLHHWVSTPPWTNVFALLGLCDNDSLFWSIWELFALQTQLSASLKASKCLWVPNYHRAYRKPLKCERNLQNYLKIEDFMKSSRDCTTLDLRSLGASCTQESCQTAPRTSQ